MDNCTAYHLEPVGRNDDDEVRSGVAMEGDQAGKMRKRGIGGQSGRRRGMGTELAERKRGIQ